MEMSFIQIQKAEERAGLRGERGLILMWKILCLWDIQVVMSV